jgi:hypothetical protein
MREKALCKKSGVGFERAAPQLGQCVRFSEEPVFSDSFNPQ